MNQLEKNAHQMLELGFKKAFDGERQKNNKDLKGQVWYHSNGFFVFSEHEKEENDWKCREFRTLVFAKKEWTMPMTDDNKPREQWSPRKAHISFRDCAGAATSDLSWANESYCEYQSVPNEGWPTINQDSFVDFFKAVQGLYKFLEYEEWPSELKEWVLSTLIIDREWQDLFVAHHQMEGEAFPEPSSLITDMLPHIKGGAIVHQLALEQQQERWDKKAREEIALFTKEIAMASNFDELKHVLEMPCAGLDPAKVLLVCLMSSNFFLQDRVDLLGHFLAKNEEPWFAELMNAEIRDPVHSISAPLFILKKLAELCPRVNEPELFLKTFTAMVDGSSAIGKWKWATEQTNVSGFIMDLLNDTRDTPLVNDLPPEFDELVKKLEEKEILSYDEKIRWPGIYDKIRAVSLQVECASNIQTECIIEMRKTVWPLNDNHEIEATLNSPEVQKQLKTIVDIGGRCATPLLDLVLRMGFKRQLKKDIKLSNESKISMPAVHRF